METISARRLRRRAAWARKSLIRLRLQLGPHPLGERTHLLGDVRVVSVARLIEKLADVLISQPVDQAGLAEKGLTAAFDDLAQQPLKILLRPFAHRQCMHGVLHRDRADPLQPPPDLDPQIGGLGRKLVNEQQPAQGQRSLRRSSVHGKLCIR